MSSSGTKKVSYVDHQPDSDLLARRERSLLMAGTVKFRGLFKKWNWYHCYLYPGRLLYYSKEPGSLADKEEGEILFTDCTVNQRPSKKKGFCFKVVSTTKHTLSTGAMPWGVDNVIMRVLTQDEMYNWIEAIRASIFLGSDTHPDTSDVVVSLRDRREARERGEDPDAADDADTPIGIEPAGPLEDYDMYAGDDGASSESLDYQEGAGTGFPYEEPAQPAAPAVVVSPPKANRNDEDSDPFSSSDEGGMADAVEQRIARRVEYDSYEDYSAEETDAKGKGEADSDDGDVTWEQYVFEGNFSAKGEVTEDIDPNAKGLVGTLLSQVRPGMDLSKIVLPTFILEPRSFLEKLTDFFAHCNLVSEALANDNPRERMVAIMQYYVSGFYIRPEGVKKPYNPILGEVFRCKWQMPSGSTVHYVAEQVSHHPPISALYVSCREDGWVLNGSIRATSTFRVYYIIANLVGTAHLYDLRRNHVYRLTFPSTQAKGFLTNSLSSEICNNITVECADLNMIVKMEFKVRSMLWGGGELNEVAGTIAENGKTFAKLSGHWDDQIDVEVDGKKRVLWKVDGKADQRVPYYRPVLADQDEWESVRLWQHVTKAINEKDQEGATEHKFTLEQAQRQAKKDREAEGVQWETKLFVEGEDEDMPWVYKYACFEPLAPNEIRERERNFQIVPVSVDEPKVVHVMKRRKVKRFRTEYETVRSNGTASVSGAAAGAGVGGGSSGRTASERSRETEAVPITMGTEVKTHSANPHAAHSPPAYHSGSSPAGSPATPAKSDGAGPSFAASPSSRYSTPASSVLTGVAATSSSVYENAVMGTPRDEESDAELMELQAFKMSAARELRHLTKRLAQLESKNSGSSLLKPLLAVLVCFVLFYVCVPNAALLSLF